MIIFDQEDKIKQKILANMSFAYLTQVEEATEPKQRECTIAKLGIETDTPESEDLFYTRSILVSTGRNKNDDVFDPVETWRARYSSIDKPTNIEHDETRIIGHITANWIIDDNGRLIDDETPIGELPSSFHIANSAVIYKHWKNPELVAQAMELIDSIKAGNMFVSMECAFSGFDYYLYNETESRLIPRTAETAYLSQYLRAYGGSGVYGNDRVARVLRNIVFTGKGYVQKPANPDSIIFHNREMREKSGVYDKCSAQIKTEENKMSEILEKQVAELKSRLDEASKANEELRDKLAKADIEKYEARIAELEKQLSDAECMTKKKEKQMAEDLEKAEEAKACMCQQFEETQKENEALKAELQNIKKEALLQARVNAFVERGFSKEDAASKAKEFASLDDETFSRVVALVQPKTQDPISPKTADADVVVEEGEEETVDANVSDDGDDEFAALKEEALAYYQDRFQYGEKEKK